MNSIHKQFYCPKCGSDDLVFLCWCDEGGEMIRNWKVPNTLFQCLDCKYEDITTEIKEKETNE